MAPLGGPPVPLRRLGRIRGRALPPLIAAAQGIHGVGIALLRRPAVELDSPGLIPFCRPAGAAELPQQELGPGVAPLRRPLEPADGLLGARFTPTPWRRNTARLHWAVA